jgi:hypothetical protein
MRASVVGGIQPPVRWANSISVASNASNAIVARRILSAFGIAAPVYTL